MGQLCLALLALLACTNAKILRYEMLIAEEPVKIVQVVTFDEEAGLRFVEVPKHLDLMKTLHVADLQDRRLSLEVVEELEVCYIGKPRRHLEPKEEQEALGNFTQRFDSHKVFSSKQAVHEELIFLAGAHITHNELPPKLKPYCPPDYRVQTFRYINKEEHMVTVSESGAMIIQDPTIQRNYTEGDFLMTEEDNLPEGLNLVSRRKRTPQCRALTLSGHGSRATNTVGCHWLKIKCRKKNGCPATNVYYTCVDQPRRGETGYTSCEYILMCATVDGNGCAVHATARDGRRCTPCCISDSCGGQMPKCSAAMGGVSPAGRTLTMEINMRKERASSHYDVGTSSMVTLNYKGKSCTTSILPSILPNTPLVNGKYVTRHKIEMNMENVLGTCFKFDISGNPETMSMELKLARNSPISVTRVQVIDSSDTSKCWTSKWKNAKRNQKTDEWVTASSFEYDDDCVD